MAIQYRGTGISGNNDGSTGTTLTITLPTGWQAGDILFCIIRLGSASVTGFSQTGGTGTWTIDFSAANATGGFYYVVAHRITTGTDTGPTFTWTTATSFCTSCGGFFSSISSALSLDKWATSDPVQNSSAGTSVTPNAVTGAGGTEASIILTCARGSASSSATTHAYTPPTGWTWNDGDTAFYAGGANPRFAANCYQLGVSGTVTPIAQTLTDSASDSFFFDVFHALVSEAGSAVVTPVVTPVISRMLPNFPVRVVTNSGWRNAGHNI